MTYVPQFAPQEYTPLYVSINHNLQTEVQSVTVNRMDGGATVDTIVRDWAGRVRGASKTDCTLKGVIPYIPTDQSGEGFNAAGMLCGADPSTQQFDMTMLTSANANQNLPVTFTIAIGNGPAAQQLIFNGFITAVSVDAAVGKQSDYTISAEGQFALFQ